MKNIIEEFNKSKVNFKNIKVVETELGNKIDTMNIKVEKNPEDYFKEDLKEEKRTKEIKLQRDKIKNDQKKKGCC